MPPPTSSLKPAPAAATADANGSSVASAKDKDTHYAKPDQQAYNAEQDGLNKQIDTIKAQLNEVRSRIDLTRAPTSENDRRSVLKAELDTLRNDRGKFKGERSKTLDEVKRLQEVVQKKIKDVQAQRAKLPYKSSEEIDQRISSLDREIESGKLTLLNEKKALAEITSLRRARRQVETSQEMDNSISSDRTHIDELRKQLDDPEAKAHHERFESLQKELDGLRDQGNKAWEEKNKLFEQRTALSAEMDTLYNKKRDSNAAYREAGDKYWAKVQEERQAKQDRYKSEKANEDAARREEQVEQMRETAKMPAFATEIEDCSVLIGWFNGRYGSGPVPDTNASKAASTEKTIAGVKTLDIRQVDGDLLGVQLKKKDEETWGGVSGGGKKKGGKAKKGVAASSGAGSGIATPSTSSASTSLPLHLLTALLSLSIPPPSSKDDVSRVISDLETKKAWFEANSETKTKAEIARVEKEIAKILKKNKGVETEVDEVETEKDGSAEPTHTVAIEGEATGQDTVLSQGTQLPAEKNPSDPKLKKVDSELEEIKEQQSEA